MSKPRLWNRADVRAKIDPSIIPYASSRRQREVVEAVIMHGCDSKAAAADLGIDVRGVQKHVSNIRAEAAAKGYKENTTDIPDGFRLKGRSTLLDADGNTKVEWIKTEADKQRQLDIMKDVTESLAEGIKPWPRVKPPKNVSKDLCSVYTITDYHIGAYSTNRETGESWDLQIAEDTLHRGINAMMGGCPDSEQAVFVQMGDFLHFDGLQAVTPMSKHALDASGRYSELVEVAVKTCVNSVEMLLHKHKNVHVVMCEGNHDMAGSIWLQAIMKMAFAKNPRVTIDDSGMPYYQFRWGNVFLGWHHGHLTRIKNLSGKFFSEPEFRTNMASCKHIYISTGHLHTREVIESSGAVIERHPTLAARDAYAARGFEHSQRGALAITYDKDRGEIARVTATP
jgi:hypothetical protein